MIDPLLTERDAAVAWALAYNTHDLSALASILADDVRVMSQWVVRDLVGRDAYIDYLGRKFTTFEQAGSMIRVEVGETPGASGPAGGRPCALLEQDGSLLATVIFDVVCGRLTQVSLSANPPPGECVGSGVFPGFFEAEASRVN